MEVLKSNFFAAIVEKFMAYSAPAIPARAAEVIKAVSLYLVILIPTDSAAMRLSRIAVIARPERLYIRFITIKRVKSMSTKPAVNEAIFVMPTAP